MSLFTIWVELLIRFRFKTLFFTVHCPEENYILFLLMATHLVTWVFTSLSRIMRDIVSRPVRFSTCFYVFPQNVLINEKMFSSDIFHMSYWFPHIVFWNLFKIVLHLLTICYNECSNELSPKKVHSKGCSNGTIPAKKKLKISEKL